MNNHTTDFTYSSALARKVIMPITALLFFLIYYFVCTTPIGCIQDIRIICVAALLCLCVFGAIFLLADSREMRLRKIFALQMLLVAFAAGFTLVRIITEKDVAASSSQFVTPGVLLYGNTFAFIMLLYPFELLSLQRMTLWDYCKLFLPALLCGLFFYGYVLLTGVQMTEVKSMQILSENFYKFDVWFRIVLLIYPIWLFTRILYQKKRYIAWCRSNLSNTDCVELDWLDYYLFGYFIILGSYLSVMLTGNRQSLLMHSLAFLLFFGFVFYHTLRRRTPDTSELSADDHLAESEIGVCPACDQAECATAEVTDDKFRFVDKIPFYKNELEHWMQDEKPYKNKDFKLLDMMQVLPLNRSYISRLFNEGYGETFFDFVMRLRLDESVRLLEQHPEMNIRRISDLCGFSSPSVFGRAFLKHKGVTPKQYRKDIDMEI